MRRWGGVVGLLLVCTMSPTRAAPTAEAVAIVSTRGSFDMQGKLLAGVDPLGFKVEGEVPGWNRDLPAPPDLVIVVHGFNNRPDKALFKFELAAEGLRGSGYSGGICGWSWDSDRQRDRWAATGYHAARRVAVANGPMLAQFIREVHERSPDTRIHVVGYSMGARLALEAVLVLDDTPSSVHFPPPIETLHLVGAAVDNEEVELGERYGHALERKVGQVWNYHSSEDNKLGAFYWAKEGDRALGKYGIEHRKLAPANWHDVEVGSQLHSYTKQDVLREGEDGDNHSGYLGNRAADGRLLDDGVVDLIAENIGL